MNEAVAWRLRYEGDTAWTLLHKEPTIYPGDDAIIEPLYSESAGNNGTKKETLSEAMVMNEISDARLTEMLVGLDQFRSLSIADTRTIITELQERRASGQVEPLSDDDDRMQKISEVITHLQSIQQRFGDTCVYIRRGGMSWGAVALNRRDDDKKHGVFDLQAQHDRDMTTRLQQVERLISDNRDLRSQVAASLVTETSQKVTAPQPLSANPDSRDREAKLVEALEQALLHIEVDETTHGRPFAAGNVVRAALGGSNGTE